MKRGWIKQWRCIEDWEWYKDANMVHLFGHIVRRANREDKQWMGTIVKRGQLITGRQALSLQTGLSPRSVRTCLERLKTTSEIAIETTNKYSIITIIEYDKYQQSENDATSRTTSSSANERPTNDQQTTTNKNVKNIKNDNNTSTSEDVEASPTTIDITTTDVQQEKVKSEVQSELENFVAQLNSCRIFPVSKIITPQVKVKWSARRREYSVEELQLAFMNLLNEPDKWKITNNGHRPLAWWLHSQERIEDMKQCHLKQTYSKSNFIIAS